MNNILINKDLNKILINKDLHLCYKYNLVIDEIVDCFKNPKKYSEQLYNQYPNIFDARRLDNYYILDDCGILDIVKEKYTFNILRKMCKKNGITAYRNKSKKELIRLLIGL